MKEILFSLRPAKTKEEAGIVRRGPILMEQAFAALHHVKEAFSLEIGTIHNQIGFFARCSEKTAATLEGQMYAQYPDADVESMPPENLEPSKEDVIYSMEMCLAAPTMFPIKRHPQFDDLLNKVTIDPLSALTSTLTRFPVAGMRGHITVTIRPAGNRFRKRALQFFPLVTKGLSRRWLWYRLLFTKVHLARGWQRLLFFPIDMLLGGFRSFFVNVGKLSVVETTTSSSAQKTEEKLASRNHDRENILQGAQDKMQRLLFEVSITLSVITKKEYEDAARSKLEEIAGSFKQFALPQSNAFRIGKFRRQSSLPGRTPAPSMLLNNEELATLWHLPTILVKTPNITWVQYRKLEPPQELPLAEKEKELTVLGTSVFRGVRKEFGIRQDDRRRHLYAIGKTGMGKSTLLENMINSDIATGKGVAVIDPHGDLADAVLRMVPKERTNDVVLFDPTDLQYPISFNMLECQNSEQRPLVAAGIMSVFTKIWPDVWSGRMEHILRNTLLALLESPGNSMLGILRIYADDAFRKKIVEHLTDPLVRSFWEDEYTAWSPNYRTEAVAAIQNKVGQLLTTPIIRNIVGQSVSRLDLRHAMDTGKIVIANLSKGKLGEDNANFLGSMLVTRFQIDAMSRADLPESDRRDFYLYVDEFQNFATTSFATILSEARKYRLNLTMANQFIGQLTPEKSTTMLRDAVFGNVGTIVSFQVGSEDAEEIAEQFGDEELNDDILNLPKYHAYMRLMIEGLTSRPFSVSTLPPPLCTQDAGRIEKIRSLSRERYAVERSIVEKKIAAWAKHSSQAKGQQRINAKQQEKEMEERKKAKKKGMKLEEYRKWRDREMWTNELNALKKKEAQGEKLSTEEQKRKEELEKNLAKAGGPTVQAADPEKRKRNP